jgi:hypothetical protein
MTGIELSFSRRPALRRDEAAVNRGFGLSR